jgi:cell division protein ZapA
MSRLSLTINGHPYALACDDGQEPRIRRLAQYVDARVGEFVKTFGQVGEARLMLLAALAIADELADANEELAQEKSRNRAGQIAVDDAVDLAAAGMHDLAQRIEAIAARLESP